MSNTIIKLENISKQYRLGTVGSKTLRGDLQRWWYNLRGKEDPTLKIGQTNQLNQQSSTNNRQSDNFVWALRDINLEVKQGEVLGIIGKNGAGKSTLLKLLSRVTGPTTGQIKVKGRIASLLEVGTGFHPELTGKENIFLNGAILGMTKPEIKAKFDEIVDFAGVAKYINTPVKRYSSGMYVRLAFAVAAHLEPDILVVDEVLAVGDAEFQKKAIGKMQDVSQKGGRTVLFVSHNMKSVKALCTRGILLNNGTIQTTGDIDYVIDTYMKEVSADKEILENRFEKDKNFVESIKIETFDNRNVFFHNDTLKIHLSINLVEDISDLELNIAFWDKDVKLFMFFASKMVNKGFNQKEPFKKGINTISFVLPEGLLNDGRYYIHFALHRNFKEFLHVEKNALIFDIVDNIDFMDDYRTSNKSKFNIEAENVSFEHSIN